MNSIEFAKQQLNINGCTCVFVRDGSVIYDSKIRGVRPLLELLEKKTDVFDAYVCDKVVGKAAAFLYVLLKVKSVYALVISKPAKAVLEKYNITVTFDNLADGIENRQKNGPCPMENAVIDETDPQKALELIIKKQIELNK